MTGGLTRRAPLAGALLVMAYTALISSADAITKFIAGGYAPPQLYAISGGLVALFCLCSAWVSSAGAGPVGVRARLSGALATTCPRAMAARSIATVLASTCYFYAFRDLPMAEVFVFIGMMPIFAGLMSGPILGERVSLAVWIALGAGFVGMICLFPAGLSSLRGGHVVAALACLAGTFSMVMARLIGRHESNSLAQVFYPNLMILAVMGAALPFVFRPMPLQDVAWAVAYAVLLFFARWVLVVALRHLAAYVVTPLTNMQFVWMVILGAAVFDEFPAPHVFLGVGVVMGSGIYLIWDQLVRRRPLRLKRLSQASAGAAG